ncbi:hypothetical protein JCM10908_003933 [Rhodotorula pacifica]|uniref:uncharacterized protein n=1 Tax=Rhodotorula pacifica TaxID=1495444 RepID=UPI0031771597
MIPTYTRFAASTAGPSVTKSPVRPPYDPRAGPHESVKNPTAWAARKSAARGISPVLAWPLTIAFVGVGALWMYNRSGGLERDMKQVEKGAVFASPKEK